MNGGALVPAPRAMRAILIAPAPTPQLGRLLFDFRSMVRPLLRGTMDNKPRSAVALRKETKEGLARSWRSRYVAHGHPSACSTAVGIARSYGRLRRPRAMARPSEPSLPCPKRLMARVEQELVRIKGNELVLPVRPGSTCASL